MTDIVIIGGGAAGLAAAVTAAREAPGATVTVLERDARVGKKLLVTGNGRCNLTNRSGLQGRYAGDEAFARAAFARFGVDDTLALMEDLGVNCVTLEEGKVYPRSLQAGSVADQLRLAAQEAGAALVTDQTVTRLAPDQGGWQIVTQTGTLSARRVLVATGGKAGVGRYSGPTGYDLLQALGHTVTPLFPAIVQLTTETAPIKPLTGIKTQGVMTLRTLTGTRREAGEILFTEYGLSGPPVLQVSRLLGPGGTGRATLDLLPDLTEEAVAAEIDRRRNVFGNRPCEDLLLGFMNKRLGQTVIKRAGIEKLSRPVGTLTGAETAAIARTAKGFELAVTGTRGFGAAQVTAGGVNTEDFDPATMESKRAPGLYAAGEVLNVTGDCGGFNLQWAWTSGVLAGRAMARGSAT